ncbi:AAA family ATPase [Massilia sp. CCM 8733]|uniref:AAA family ATPase n=1 Tax=Massilia mucilaginosa TaxID=2609282 RepID=A0ABX0NVJ5_9BURK|nr:AAA family ATPase [Massilia mucilaginosa]NHZ90755.1 AAA family ATPase [Massilia mucilaginosa]
MSHYFARPMLASSLARQLIHPDVLSEGFRSGLFMSGQRRTGKTTFLHNDLIPALEREGALVIYVDLWSDTRANPAQLVRDAIRDALAQLQTPGSSLLARLARVSGVDVGALSFKFGFKLEKIGETGGTPLSRAITELVDQARCDVVLIVDEVQQAITTDEGKQLLLALKAARDAVNPRPGTAGHFISIGTGSHRAMVSELTARRTQAFSGAQSIPYPVLDADYTADLLARLHHTGVPNVPSHEVVLAAFRTLGHRPEELLKALRQVQLHTPAGQDPDGYLPVVAATLRAAAADIELAKVEQLGQLASVVFERIAAAQGEAKGVFSAEAAAHYSRALGREVKVEEIGPVVNELMASNLILRRAHGLYCVADPAVQETWREKQQLLG